MQMSAIDTDVIIVGAAPTGLTLATELCLAGLRPLVLERLPEIRTVKKAGGLGGRSLQLLRYRELGERLGAAAVAPAPVPRFPFGGIHVDLSALDESPMQAMLLPQPQLEGLLQTYARELGAHVRRGHEVVGLSQDDTTVTADIRGPDGPYRITARYLVGCDGIGSRIRELAGIPFPGNTYPEVNRLVSTTMPDGVTVHENGDVEVPGLGGLPFGYTQTEGGVFAISAYPPDSLGVYTSEVDEREYDDDIPMTLAEMSDSIRRVLGAELPLGEPTRLTRFTFGARLAERFRAGRVLLAGDAAHQFPSGGVAVNAGMLDAVNLAWKLAATVAGWAPAGLLDTYHSERHFAGARTLMHTQAQVALRRGHDPAAEALRTLFTELVSDDQAAHRIGALIAGADIRYPMPGSDPHALAGTFAPDLTLHTDRGTTTVAQLMHAARPVFLDLADRADLREVARDWADRVDIHVAGTDRPPADALLIRPDVDIAWAARLGEPAATAAPALRGSLSYWFGDELSEHPRSIRESTMNSKEAS
jgi:2-polyprenyl-6-methoxyphenol hydroxylase-like FAD-dependent oxidoreductase